MSPKFLTITAAALSFSLLIASPHADARSRGGGGSKSKSSKSEKGEDPDLNWLPNLSGLKRPSDVSIADELKNAEGGDDDSCSGVPRALRALVFSHFKNTQALLNAQGKYLTAETARKWAHVVGMIMQESSGDSTNVTDMDSRERGTYEASTDLDRWRSIHDYGGITYNSQTNYGLAQISPDRLTTPFELTQWFSSVSGFLGGKSTERTDSKARKLVWLYQDFSRGRLSHDQDWIRPEDRAKPGNPERLKEGVREALWHCGTRFMFKEGRRGPKGQAALEEALQSISYCSLGSWSAGYGRGKSAQNCFSNWATLCPNLNIDIALLSPLAYFQSRNAEPLCANTFKKLLKTGDAN